MEFILFKKIVDEPLTVDNITLHHFGDPLLHPRLTEMIDYAKDAGIRHVNLSTSGASLSNERAEDLLNSSLDLIIFSVDGIGQVYEAIRVGAEWDATLKNIRYFLEMKTVGKPEVWLQIIDMPMVNLESTMSFWKSFDNIDKIQVKQFSTWGGQVPSINKIKSKKQVCPRQPCPILLTSMVICWDGTCVPCCRDYDAKVNLGNVKNENLLTVFNGNKYIEFRQKHQRGEFDNSLCQNCVGWAEALGEV